MLVPLLFIVIPLPPSLSLLCPILFFFTPTTFRISNPPHTLYQKNGFPEPTPPSSPGWSLPQKPTKLAFSAFSSNKHKPFNHLRRWSPTTAIKLRTIPFWWNFIRNQHNNNPWQLISSSPPPLTLETNHLSHTAKDEEEFGIIFWRGWASSGVFAASTSTAAGVDGAVEGWRRWLGQWEWKIWWS